MPATTVLSAGGAGASIRFQKESPGVFTAIFSIDNTGTDRCDALGFVAVYDDSGKLRKINRYPIFADAGESATEQATVEILPGFTAKAFLWDAQTYVPLCEAAVASVIPLPVLTDGGDTIYTDKGSTGITGSIDTYISAVAGTQYYYLFAGLSRVDVYYSGVSESPVGSYFPGSLINGAFVKTIFTDPNLDMASGILVGSDFKINIPMPGGDRPYVLKIIAFKGGVASEVFTHTFEIISTP